MFVDVGEVLRESRHECALGLAHILFTTAFATYAVDQIGAPACVVDHAPVGLSGDMALYGTSAVEFGAISTFDIVADIVALS